ncbi:MAG TPA: glycosyltransferase [Candidatus Limnocylindrales bacterium]|nr:glycosyltransferase [Candidatus Limnocylindrales bacterium]
MAISPIAIDARVLRQIDYLAPHFDLVVTGLGEPPSSVANRPGLRWVEMKLRYRRLASVIRLPLLFLSRFGSERILEAWYWSSPTHRAAYRNLLAALPTGVIGVHANDWITLPMALRLRRERGARVVLDLHEYAPLEFEERRMWRLIYPRPITVLLKRSARMVDASITVAPTIAERYEREFGLHPVVVLNVPESESLPNHRPEAARIRLIHHGVAQRQRQLELAIEAVARADARFTLDFMLIGNPAYVAELKARAAARAPNRVHFREPVPPALVPTTIAAYDLGVFFLPPTGYSKAQALPNKLFDFMRAGLGVVVGPTPAMAAFVREHQIGTVARSFDPTDLAAALSELSEAEIEAMRDASRRTGETFTAAKEMAKVVDLYQGLLAPP